MSERILDFDAADVLAKQQAQTESMADGGPAYVVAFPPAYRAALEAQAQAAVDNAMELKHGDLYENFRQARFRYERAEAKLAAQADPLRAEHQRLKDAVVATVGGFCRSNSRKVTEHTVEALRLRYAALAAFEAQHPEVQE